MQVVARWIGAVTLVWLVLFAAGVPPWWSRIDTQSGVDVLRVMALLALHFGGIIFGALSFDDSVWKK